MKFAAMILTHGRPDNVATYNTLKLSGYSGDIVLVLDNEDDAIEQYKKNYPDARIYVFNKELISKTFDTCDTPSAKRNAIVYARNACFEIAKELGYTHFIQLDDDYTTFSFTGCSDTNDPRRRIKNLNTVFALMCDFLDKTSVLTICMSQGGDYVLEGRTQNRKNKITERRKAMNSFVCKADRPFQFIGRINEDVNTYTAIGSKGGIMLTTPELYLEQKQTQSNSGGMTDIYKQQGTYVKSFYSVIVSPSSVRINMMGIGDGRRLHHRVDWNKTTPKIVRESIKKG